MDQPKIIEFWCAYGGKHPVIGDVWYRISAARGSEASKYSRYMCDALSMIAHRASDCDTMLSLIDAVIAGKSKKEEYGLNDTCVIFEPNIAQVNILIEEKCNSPLGRFELNKYRKVVQAWRDFLLMPEAGESKMRIELSIAPNIAPDGFAAS
ncbi:hypothetical protein [Azonexus sp.]|uniref:hypothetical protein n=1 Tax=Azonexus sp. TaxID=1872668 RepID=UPI00283A9483|nr:hypothetical protein [Azonexus sp.]